MQVSVKQDRQKYIGGSDIPAIMNISPFMSRYDLLLIKAGIKENEFEGNRNTEYGNIMEEKIRNYINQEINMDQEFIEDKFIKDDIRCHVDGYNGECILEIKTTSQIHENLSDYKVYLVQLLFYMMNYHSDNGILAVYERPENFSEIFDKKRLKTYYIDIKDYEPMCEEIKVAVDNFRNDLIKIKENPLLTEEDLIPVDIQEISSAILKIENELNAYKVLEKRSKELKQQLYEAMEKEGLKKWTTPNGTQITRVESKEDTTELKFNEKKFSEDQPNLYAEYCEETIKKGRAGYVLVTPPKE